MSNVLYTYRHHIQLIRDLTMKHGGNFIIGVNVAATVFNHAELNGGSLVFRARPSRPVSLGELWLGCIDVIVAHATEDAIEVDTSEQVVRGEILNPLHSYFASRDDMRAAKLHGGMPKDQRLRDRNLLTERALASALALTIYESGDAGVQGDLVTMYLEYATMIRFGTFGRPCYATSRHTSASMTDAYVLDALNSAHRASEVENVNAVCQPGRGSLERAMPRFWRAVFDNLDAVQGTPPENADVASIGKNTTLRDSRIAALSESHIVSEAIRSHAASAIGARFAPSIDIVAHSIPQFEDHEEDRNAVADEGHEPAPSAEPVASVLLNADASFASDSHISRVYVA